MAQTQIHQTMSPNMVGQMQNTSMLGVNQSVYPNQSMGPQTVYMQPQDSGSNKIIIFYFWLLLVVVDIISLMPVRKMKKQIPQQH